MKTNTYRSTAVIVGVLFIIGTVAGILSGVVTGPILDGAEYIERVAANEGKIILGALLVLVMGFPLAMIPAMLFPIFKKENEVLALGAVIFRGVLEAVTYIILAICWLLLVSISQGSMKVAGANAINSLLLGHLVRQLSYWTEHILAIVFSIGALMIYWLFYKTRLIPRWLSLWGFLGALLYLASPVLNLFDPQHLALSLGVSWGNLMAPLAIQEMIFALWLIIKGFNSKAPLLTNKNPS
jgi:hypothetical protein